MATFSSGMRQSTKRHSDSVQLSKLLDRCWSCSFDFNKLPEKLSKHIHQVGKALSMPAEAVLAGLLMVISFSLSHSEIEVEGISWDQPILNWIVVCMPTGSGKSTLCKFLRSIVKQVRSQCAGDEEPSWVADDQSFEKLGELMDANHGKLLGLYDELSMFLGQINVCRGRTISDSTQVSTFLRLYDADEWIRQTVRGAANFSMERTGLTLGGFTQPSVAKGLLENMSNVEKGLCQRFLWLAPRPNPVAFKDLQPIDDTFVAAIVSLMATMWKSDDSIQMWKLKRDCSTFIKKYDQIESLKTDIEYMDDLLSGMLAKSKGQVLRLSVVFHVLLGWENPKDIKEYVSESALQAAINFVEVCMQHTTCLAGRKEIVDEIHILKHLKTDKPKALIEEISSTLRPIGDRVPH